MDYPEQVIYGSIPGDQPPNRVNCNMRWMLLLLFTSVCRFGFAQESEYLSNYSVGVKGDNMIVSWTTSADFRCEDLAVEHSLDSATFVSVYVYPGICGTEGKEANYFFVFKNVVFNKINYFRINLGIYGYSGVLNSTIVKNDKAQAVLAPNPANINSLIHFSNDHKDLAEVQLYNSMGQAIGVSLITNGRSVRLSDLSTLNSGLHYFSVRLNGTLLTGRFFFN